jgi:hypothetical protein
LPSNPLFTLPTPILALGGWLVQSLAFVIRSHAPNSNSCLMKYLWESQCQGNRKHMSRGQRPIHLPLFPWWPLQLTHMAVCRWEVPLTSWWMRLGLSLVHRWVGSSYANNVKITTFRRAPFRGDL